MCSAMGEPGAFAFYAAWNLVGAALVLLLVPETRARTLEELDAVFRVPTRVHATWGARQLVYFVRRHVLRQRRHGNGAALLPPRLFAEGTAPPVGGMAGGGTDGAEVGEIDGVQIDLPTWTAPNGAAIGCGGGGGGGGGGVGNGVAWASGVGVGAGSNRAPERPDAGFVIYR
jgi:hypothetical protein